MKQETKTNKPVTQIRAGNVSASVWKHTQTINKKEIDFYSVTLQKVYKDDKGEFKNINTFNREDLIKVEIVTRKAAEYIYLKEYDDE